MIFYKKRQKRQNSKNNPPPTNNTAIRHPEHPEGWHGAGLQQSGSRRQQAIIYSPHKRDMNKERKIDRPPENSAAYRQRAVDVL